MVQLAPNWTVGNIDAVLLTKFRTFDVSDTNIYNFIMNDVAKAFNCVFTFDTELRTISAKMVDNATTISDIFLSFDNLIKSSSFSEKSDEITTCLSVYGGGSLDIRAVNPLGTDSVYDFTYYKTPLWMSQSLIDALTAWENLIILNQPGYAHQLTLMKGYNLNLILLKSDLTVLNSDYSVLEVTKKTLVQQGSNLDDINSQLANKQTEISAKQDAINVETRRLNVSISALKAINNAVSFDSNFSELQLLELNNFIYQNTFKDENIIQTDSMNDVEIQNAQQDLYDQALAVLAKVSQPRYEIEINSVNFTVLPEFSIITSQTELGTVVTCETEPDVFIQTLLLEIEITLDNPENFSILLSNRVRKDGAGFVYSDLMGQVVKTGASVAFDNYKWGNWDSDYKDTVSTFIISSLNTANNNLINNSNQEILINGSGLRGRTYNPVPSNIQYGGYDPTQMWLTSSVLAFSSDGFATSKLALGAVSTNDGIKYGLVAQVIVGNLIAGNTLTISNTREDGKPTNFILDQTGATLYNSSFTIENAKAKVLLNPDDAKIFRIQKNESTGWADKFWVDVEGNVHFSGDLSGATGTFSGALSGATGTFSGDISGASGRFTGTIFADKLDGSVKVSYNQLTDIPADKITTGTMSGSRVYGGSVGFDTGYITSRDNVVYIQGHTGVAINSNSATIAVSDKIYTIGTLAIEGTMSIEGRVVVVGGSYPGDGVSVGYTVNTPYGTKVLKFSKGILTGYT